MGYQYYRNTYPHPYVRSAAPQILRPAPVVHCQRHVYFDRVLEPGASAQQAAAKGLAQDDTISHILPFQQDRYEYDDA